MSWSYFEALCPAFDVVDCLTVVIDCSVKGKARPRFDGRSGRAYMPAAYVANVETLRWVLRQALFERPSFMSTTAPYALLVRAYRKRRKAVGPAARARLDRECPLGCLAPGKPDWDNLGGTVSDAASCIVYADDDQVVIGAVVRVWSDVPGAELTFLKLRDTKGLP